MELEKEGLQNLGDISYTDNKPVLDLILNKPIGLLSLLDEQSKGLNVSDIPPPPPPPPIASAWHNI